MLLLTIANKKSAVLLFHLLLVCACRGFVAHRIENNSLRDVHSPIHAGDLHPHLIKKLYNVGLDRDFEMNCSQNFWKFLNDLDVEQRATYFDSFGKVGAGILTGNVMSLGYYDQCIDIGNTDFCRFPFLATLTTNVTGSSTAPVVIPLMFGMCFPSSCSAEEFYRLFYIDSNEVFYSRSFIDANAITYTINVSVLTNHLEPMCPWRDLEWTTSSIIMLIVCIVFIVLVIIGTLVDLLIWFINDVVPKNLSAMKSPPVMVKDSTVCEVKNSINEDEALIDDKPKLRAEQSLAETPKCIEFLKNLISSFSLYKTIPAIMTTHQPANAVTSINGIRVMSNFWVILLHVHAWQMIQGIANVREYMETVRPRFLWQPVDTGNFAVTSFFVLSGFLMCYLTIREMEHRKGRLPFVLFYVHRLLRLSPSYYFALFFYFKVLPYVGSGPQWSYVDDVRSCEKYWWTNILYINNFYPPIFANQCYVLSWYLANDMQLFIISPIFLLLLYHFWKIGLAAIVGTMLTSIAVKGTLAGIRNLSFSAYLMGTGDATFVFSSIYEKPYCQINAYLIGILLGFIFYKKWRIRCSYWISIFFYTTLWMIAAACCLAIIFGHYQTWHGHPFSKTENVLYFMFSRTGYSIGIAFMIYACHNGFGGIINTFLSWNFWVPLSRLSYMAYLTHPMVIYMMFGTLRFRYIYTDYIFIIFVVAAVVLSYGVALVFAVFVEYPLGNVESAIYKFTGVKRRK